MKAVVMDSPKMMRIAEIPRPVPGADEVLVKIAAAGICAGDLHIYEGRSPYALYPCIAGHEMAGVIAEVGRDVNFLKSGQHVVIDPFIGCGTCYACRVGKYNCCVNLTILGVHRPGGFAEYICVPANKLYLVPDRLSLSVAAFAEPIAVGIQACNRAELTTGETVLIMGCGPIGMITAEVALSRGARVIVADINSDRLLLAKSVGAEIVVADEKLVKKIMNLTDNEGAAVVIEATGVPKVIEQTVELVAAGGRIVVLGLVPRNVGVTFQGLDFTRKELTILGSRSNRNCFADALALLNSQKLIFPTLAKSFSLWDSPGLFSDISGRPALYHKAVLLNDR